jgi:three-Cys-motif partner protein
MAEHRFGGAWTEEKLTVLHKYLNAYTKVLKNQPFTSYYIDAFAGTGDRTPKREKQQAALDLPELDTMTKGSARIALEVEPPFHEYIFIEKRQRWSSALEQLKSSYPQRMIQVLNDDANLAVQRICQERSWRRERAVLFLDPYGMQVTWETMKAVAATKAMDVWTLYPTGMGLNRLLTRNGDVPEEWQATLDRFLGTEDWRTAFYEAQSSVDLFGARTEKRTKIADTGRFEAFLLDRLRTIFPRSGVAPVTLPLRNGQRQVMYLLCFACANPRGADIAVKIARSAIGRARR